MKNKIPALLSTIGLFFTVIVSPCCFPMFGFVLAGFGVATDTFELFGNWTMLIFQYMVLFSLVNLTLNYAINRNIWGKIKRTYKNRRGSGVIYFLAGC